MLCYVVHHVPCGVFHFVHDVLRVVVESLHPLSPYCHVVALFIIGRYVIDYVIDTVVDGRLCANTSRLTSLTFRVRLFG